MEIKDTLLTPKTSFPMRASLAQRESKFRENWDQNEVYKQRLKMNEGNEKFVLLDGPPYANGDLHVGHALNKILKDFTWRYKSMRGFDTQVIMGWDTHGLPIENALLKNKKIKRRELSDLEFRIKCAEYAQKQVENQKQQFLTLGLLTDGEATYTTLESTYESEQIRVFNKMIQAGMIYKGLKPVYWSYSSQTALAEAEIEYYDKTSPAIYVGFDVLDQNYENTQIVIWTTTPWTLPANQGIAVGAQFKYSVVKTATKNYIVASELVNEFLEATELEGEVINEVLGQDLEHVSVKNPVNGNAYIVMLADHVTVDSGTGCVHTAPGHGEDDYICGRKYDLEAISVVNHKGVMNDAAGKYEGLFYEDANKEITQDLTETGNLLKLSFINHSYPHDWRTKKPVFFRATPQWFASLKAVKEQLLSEIANVNWINQWGEVRLRNMIADRQDWCISRQRVWGVPIPIIYTENDEPIFDEAVIEHIASLFEEHGSNIWFEREAIDLLPAGYQNPASPNGVFYKETDIMDVWFDSGVSHSAVGKNRLGSYPADLFLEGSDQYRGWFNSSLITGTVAMGKAPYKTVLSHGFVLDGKGNKMSKSLGNTITPKEVVSKHGADILRLWVASVDFHSDVRISEEIINQVSEQYRKVRNSLRFILGNLANYDGSTFEIAQMPEVDQYLLIKLSELNQFVLNCYDNYEYKKALDEINLFLTHILSNFYFDFTKDILYIESVNNVRRRQVEFVLKTIFDKLTVMLSIVIPHTANEAYQEINGADKFVFLENFSTDEVIVNAEISSKYEKFLQFRTDVNQAIEHARNEKIIGKSLEAAIKVDVKAEFAEVIQNMEELETILIVSKVEFVENDGHELPTATIKVEKFGEHRCERCWRYYDETDLSTNSMCERCESVVKELE